MWLGPILLKAAIVSAAIIFLLLATGLVQAHEWYGGLLTPEGESCCNDQDCAPTTFCTQENGREGIVILGSCSPIPWDRVIDTTPPDGAPHACVQVYPGEPIRVLCVMLPAGA